MTIYEIISARSGVELTKKVSAKLASGYSLYGNPFVNPLAGTDSDYVYNQAVVR